MGKIYVKPDGHLTCSGILECMRRCGKYKGCCMGCPGRKGRLFGCAVDLEEEIILWFEAYDAKCKRNSEATLRRREKRKEG